MSQEEKKRFLKNLTVLIDTREQKNQHIKTALQNMGIPFEVRKLDFGDYSFTAQGRDFSLLCVVERKANPEEFYSNITFDRERIEKEVRAATSIANQFILLIENVTNEKTLKNYTIPDEEFNRFGSKRRVQDIGYQCYSTIKSWECGSRYNFKTLYVKDNQNTAKEIVETFYWWWHNYKKLTASRRNREGGA